VTRPSIYWADADPSPWRPSRAAKLAAIGAIAIVVAIIGYVLMGFLAPKYPVALTITPSVSGRTLVIDGQTDLPDGALISYELLHDLRYRELYPDETGPPPSFAADEHATPQILSGSMKVADGRFNGTASLADWPPGTVHVSVYFDPDPEQPSDVRAKYGGNNEHLGGTNVVQDSDGLRSAVAKATVSLP
jgi:hypothetical protein